MKGLSYEEALTLLSSEERPKRHDSPPSDSAKAREEYERLLRELERRKSGNDKERPPENTTRR